MTAEEPGKSRITRDRETIEQWADEYGIVPIRPTETTTTSRSSGPFGLYTETDQTEMMETVTWDEFFEEIEEEDLVVVHHGGEADDSFEVMERDQAVSRAPVEGDELQERLLGGETITSELTETTVIERTIVEHATIESEIVDIEVLDSRVVDATLVSREIGGSEVVDRDLLDESDHSRFADLDLLEGGRQSELPQSVTVEVDVDEDWRVTRELLERATIESRIIDVDVTETDEVESETVQTNIEIEGVQRSLLESNIVETEADPHEVIQSGTIESEFHEDDVVRTTLNQRRLIEDEITERKLLRGELTDSELVQVETRSSTPIETAFVDGDALDDDITPVGVTEYETDTPGTDRDGAGRVTLMEEDEGKPVVDASGDTIGMVEEVQDGRAYIDPEPGLVERIKAKLGWGDADDDEFMLDKENIGEITDDEVRLSIRE